MLFAAGNDGNYNQPDVISGLAYFVPDIAPNWLSVASVAQDAASTNSVPYTISSFFPLRLYRQLLRLVAGQQNLQHRGQRFRSGQPGVGLRQ